MAGYLQPTPVQAATIALINDNTDILVTAHTGMESSIESLTDDEAN